MYAGRLHLDGGWLKSRVHSRGTCYEENNTKQTFALGYAIAHAFYWTLSPSAIMMVLNQLLDLKLLDLLL